MTLQIVCVKQGEKYSAEYVNRLYAMVARNLADRTPGKFVCFTDDARGIREGMEIRPLPEGVSGWWCKLWLFSAGLFDEGDRILYFDLDTLIIGDLDKVARYDGVFAILRDFYRPDGMQSSVMAWEAGRTSAFWRRWDFAGRPEIPGGDQAWIEYCWGDESPDLLQDLFPGDFVSFKAHCTPYPPKGAKVVVFHGEPKLHDCGRKWVEAMWNEGSAGTFEPVLERNTHLDIVRAQSEASAKRGIPHIRTKPAHDGHVALIGGGPSLAEKLDEIRYRVEQGQKVWALNGTHDWLIRNGVVPDAMVMLDARWENVRFVKWARKATAYYIASQCHPAVYEALTGFNVTRFDLDKLGDCGTTVGTYAMTLAFIEGFRNIHLYGFDSSYRDGEGHAYEQKLNDGEQIVDVHAGDRVFRAAPWMAQQVKDFQSLARDMAQLGCTITVAGDGLLRHVVDLMENPPPTAAQQRASAVLSRLPEGTVIGAEIGVFAGDMSRLLLAREDLTLFMVDAWEGEGASYEGDSGDWHATLTQGRQDTYRQMATDRVAFAGDRATIVPMRSADAAAKIDDGSLDFVFIDADHSYEGCKADIAAWWPKVKIGGLVSGHDYENTDFPKFGVTRAVDEVAAATDQKVELGENFTWFIKRSAGEC